MLFGGCVDHNVRNILQFISFNFIRNLFTYKTSLFLDQLSNKFSCSRCKKWYQSKRSLSRHLKYECGENKGFSCPYCGKTAKQQYNLVVHARKLHPNYLKEFMDYYKRISGNRMNK